MPGLAWSACGKGGLVREKDSPQCAALSLCLPGVFVIQSFGTSHICFGS